MNQRFDLVIFDCDGVLIDSEILAVEAEAAVFSRHGLPIDTDFLLDHCMGLSWKNELELISRQFGVALTAEVADEARRETKELFATRLRAVPGIEQALDSLTVPACVASSSTPDWLEYGLGLVGLYPRFAPNIFSTALVKNGKPAPDIFLYAAERMRVVPGRCVVIEDSVHGVTAGKAAGMTVIGFTGGSHCRLGFAETLRAAGADLSITGHAELLAALT